MEFLTNGTLSPRNNLLYNSETLKKIKDTSVCVPHSCLLGLEQRSCDMLLTPLFQCGEFASGPL